jgi:hypothetical protein
MLISILRRRTDEVLYSCDHGSLKEALEAAVKAKASLRHADLAGADLAGASLRHADLAGADLRHASLAGARINWYSHTLISRILLDAAGQNVGRRKIAGLVLVSPDWCWEHWLSLRRSRHFAWAIDTLAAYVQEGDGAPRILLERAAELKAEASKEGA